MTKTRDRKTSSMMLKHYGETKKKPTLWPLFLGARQSKAARPQKFLLRIANRCASLASVEGESELSRFHNAKTAKKGPSTCTVRFKNKPALPFTTAFSRKLL